MDLATATGTFFLAIDGILSPATVRFYSFRLATLIDQYGYRELETITTNDLRRWRKTLTDKNHRYENDKYHHEQPGHLSPDYIATFVRAARALFSWLEKEGHIDHNPARRLEKPSTPIRRHNGIDQANRTKLIAACTDARDAALVKFVNSTGCRRAGAAGLLLADLNLANRSAIVREKGRGGNNKEREVKFSEDTAEALSAWLAIRHTKRQTRTKNPNLVFYLGVWGVYEVFRRAARRAEITVRWCPHQWRHGAIRRWLTAGMPLSKASELAGHSSVKVTGDIYGSSNTAELAAARDRFSPEE